MFKSICLFTADCGSVRTLNMSLTGGFPGPPSFITELEDVRVSKGRPVVLTCDVKGAESVSWYKDGIIQRNAPDFKQTFDGKSARLEIMEVFMDDYGTYTCAIKNSKAECRCSCKIFVKGGCKLLTFIVTLYESSWRGILI